MYNEVIKYTIKQSFGKKSRLVSFILVALVIMLILPIASYITNAPKSEEKLEKERIKTVYVYDETDTANLNYAELKNMDKAYKNTKIEIEYQKVLGEKTIKEVQKQIDTKLEESQGESVVIAHITYDKKYKIDITIPKESQLKKSGVSKLGDFIASLITSSNILNVAKDESELLELATPVEVTLNTLGKGEENEILMMIKMFVPMIYGFIIYFMLITYGQDITNSMVEEKNSKIIELLVAMVKPSKLVIGKVLGAVIVSVCQLILWILSLVAGIGLSNLVSRHFKKKDFIDVDFIVENLQKSNVESAFSISAILIFVVLLLLGFLFYCVFAGICGSFINKPEEASSVLTIYVYTIVIGFLVTYFALFDGHKVLLKVISYIPFSSVFVAPVNVLFGSMTIAEGLIITVIMIVCVIAMLKVLGTVYERLVFNTLSLKQLISKKTT